MRGFCSGKVLPDGKVGAKRGGPMAKQVSAVEVVGALELCMQKKCLPERGCGTCEREEPGTATCMLKVVANVVCSGFRGNGVNKS